MVSTSMELSQNTALCSLFSATIAELAPPTKSSAGKPAQTNSLVEDKRKKLAMSPSPSTKKSSGAKLIVTNAPIKKQLEKTAVVAKTASLSQSLDGNKQLSRSH